jgi:ribose transport system ATP-binding protein
VAESSALLRIAGVRKNFGATIALAGVDLEARAGEVLALVGENGAGKSTLMKILAGVHSPDAGHLHLDGKPFAPRGPLEARAAGVAMIYQELSLAPHLSVAENIFLGIEPRRGPFVRSRALRDQARAALAEVGCEHLLPDALVSELSNAEQQFVEISRAVALRCRVLVFDEPTSSLSQQDAQKLFALIHRLRAQGRAVIYISHFLEEVQALSDRYTVLCDGRSVGHGRTAEVTADQLVRLMIGRQVDELYTRSARARGEPLLDVDSLAGAAKPKNASLTVHRGEVVGVAGLIGAGRTEFLRALFGLDPVRTGRVRIAAHPDRGDTTRHRWRQGVGLLSENRKTEGLALSLPIAENLTLTRLGAFVRQSALEAASARWIERLGVRCAGPAQAVGELSGGNQQKIAFARLLHHDADLLLLDEPTRGIDVGAKQLIYQQIDALARAGKAVVVVSSYLPELLGICDRIAVMNRGVLSPARPVGEWDEHRIMSAATAAPFPA